MAQLLLEREMSLDTNPGVNWEAQGMWESGVDSGRAVGRCKESPLTEKARSRF